MNDVTNEKPLSDNCSSVAILSRFGDCMMKILEIDNTKIFPLFGYYFPVEAQMKSFRPNCHALFPIMLTVICLVILAPHPSKKCQRLFGQLCIKDNQLANEFLNGLLNQLNWSFSEFLGMLQEVWYSVSFCGFVVISMIKNVYYT